LIGWTRADPAFAPTISGYMLWSARGIAKQALAQLLDQEHPNEDRLRIREVILACEGVRSTHDLRTRSSSDRVFIEYHLEVDGRVTIDRGHAISDVPETAARHCRSHGSFRAVRH
jgi:ferrous-iron efflux pump FieF